MPKKTKKPAEPSAGPVALFGYQLRGLRQRAGLTYTAIADKSYYSKSAVHAVDQGHQLPSAAILEAFVSACGEDPQPWLDRRGELAEQLKLAEKSSLKDQGLPAPSPAKIVTPTEFNDGLKRLREWSGLTYRQIEERTLVGTPVRVPPSTLSGAFSCGTLPRQDLVVSFFYAIGLDPCDRQAWLATWQTIKSGTPAPTTIPIPESTWLAALPTEPGPGPTTASGHTYTAFEAPAPPIDNGTDSELDTYVISTYLPIAAIRDWRHRDGQWQPVDGQALPDWPQPVPPAGTHGAAGWRTRFAVTLLLVIAAAILILTVIS